MSDFLTHECGIALVRLLRPPEYYREKYGTALWGFQKLFLLMEKQHNRGHDGVGIGATKLNMPAGLPYMARVRSARPDSLGAVFRSQMSAYDSMIRKGRMSAEDAESIKMNFDDREPWELSETCALDVADRGGVTLEEVGGWLNLTRERVRQLEVHALALLRGVSEAAELMDLCD